LKPSSTKKVVATIDKIGIFLVNNLNIESSLK